jgi:dihydroorotate dehydrogenase
MTAKPWLWLSPQLAHKISPAAIQCMGWFSPSHPPQWQSLTWRNLVFPNRLGLAGGVDKDAANVQAWSGLGSGFVEIGTVTPLPQSANPGLVVDRSLSHEALWNKLGFPSAGLEVVKSRLQKLRRPYPAPLFANIGKNRSTSLEDAPNDYLQLLHGLRGLVDGFVINISSPNTQGLRDLLKPERLHSFLQPILRDKTDLTLLKLSPDLSEAELKQALDVSCDLGIDGWVLTNTTLERAHGLTFPTEGGVSGRPLAQKSKEFLKTAIEHLGKRRSGKLIVSVGGVMEPQDVFERLELGADLVQVYSALIFHGPLFFRQVAKWQKQKNLI